MPIIKIQHKNNKNLKVLKVLGEGNQWVLVEEWNKTSQKRRYKNIGDSVGNDDNYAGY